ncbi:hypothetical protein FQR65_LT18436 [Abscondita terminalis]|nr:hypothetical protein FQR65_LT18436 [Abscondita terminalis]
MSSIESDENHVDILITEIQSRPALWNTKLASYKNKRLRDKSYAEVGEILGIPKKWRALFEPLHNHAKAKGICGLLKPDHVGAEQPLHNAPPPRKLRKQTARRERNMQEKRDGQIWPQLTEHGGDELQLVVVHPHNRPFGGDLGGSLSEALIDAAITIPPLAVVLGRRNHIVIQRPQRAV